MLEWLLGMADPGDPVRAHAWSRVRVSVCQGHVEERWTSAIQETALPPTSMSDGASQFQ